MIPCKECIALAACRQKNDVDCQPLYDWLRHTDNDGSELFFIEGIVECFPGLRGFSRYLPPPCHTVFFIYNDEE